MENDGRMTIEAAGDALRILAEELDSVHAPPFSACFFDEHWDAIERVLRYLVDGDPEE